MRDVEYKNRFPSALGNVFLMLAIGIVLGCICINIIWRLQGDIFESDWVLALEKIHQYVEIIPYLPSQKNVIFLLIGYACVFALSFWKYGKILMQGFIASFGFLLGGMETIWLLNFNIKDGLFFVFDFLTRTIWICLITLLVLVLFMKRVLKGRNYTKAYVFFMLLILILCLSYIILLSYVNFT